MVQKFVVSLYTFPIYFLLFSVTMFFVVKAEKEANRIRINKIQFVFFSILAIMIPVVFAGLRGAGVGTDIKAYAINEYGRCVASSSLDNYLQTTQVEMGYAFMMWISSHFFKGFNYALTFTELLQVIPIYLVAFRLRKEVKMWSVMLTFLCINYIVGFNIMRQSISAAWLLLCYVELIGNRKLRSFISMTVGLLFHSTAVIGIAFIIIGWSVYYIKKKWVRRLIILVGSVFIILLMTNWYNIASFLLAAGILPYNRFKVYIDVFSGVSVGSKSYMFEVAISQYIEILLKVVWWVVPVISFYKRSKKFEKEKLDSFVSSIAFITLIGTLINALVLIVFHSAFGYRMAIYAEYFFIIYIPLSCSRISVASSIKKSYSNRKAFMVTKYELLTYLMLFASFYILFMFFGQHETLPLYFEIYS